MFWISRREYVISRGSLPSRQLRPTQWPRRLPSEFVEGVCHRILVGRRRGGGVDSDQARQRRRGARNGVPRGLRELVRAAVEATGADGVVVVARLARSQLCPHRGRRSGG